ncbi:hypothetical protein BU14_0071s0041 [Porphyra umbilicalis]|uniref:Uncharacterized protein n=1 Tax=Porphyra umbilicalis TaxID=2786 RepID=A0A1X6PG07_PORUM|nr:hypothetical protein BU14_0071s0041 [Porphyra umbilicalis]|eukprot:OSX79787.1 hypothetical protein BU14_0071s0041 [Porphyra umbilicalis]
MAADAPAAPTPSADAVTRAAQDAGGVSGASDAPSGVAGVPGAGGASSTTFFPFVRLGIVKLWHDTVHARARRHQSRGVSKRLQVASISAHLVATDSWVKRLRIEGKPIDKAAVSRLISKAVTLYNATNTIKAHNTGKAAGYIEGRVNERVREQGKAWRMEYADTKSIVSIVIDTQPLVGGVQRVTPPFGGSPPDDGLPGTTGGSGRQGGAGEDGGESHEARTGGEGGGASGRARRAAVADAAVEAVLPGGGDFMRSLAASLSDGARRFDEKQKTKRLVALEAERTKRVAMLTAAIEKHPDNETIRDMLKAAMGGGSS